MLPRRRPYEDEYGDPSLTLRCEHGIPFEYAECDACKLIRRLQLEEDMHDQWWTTDDEGWPSSDKDSEDAYFRRYPEW